MKRVLLLVATNVAVMLVLSIVVSILGVDRWLLANGINYGALLWLSAIDGSEGTTEFWLVQTVHKLADAAGIGKPEVAIYDGPANAFATGAFRNSALVAVSSGLVQSMSREEVEAVLGHEVSHVANGDMVTLTLIQGVLNTFVFFLSRVVGYIIDRAVFRSERGQGMGFFVTVMVCQIVFGIL